MIKPHLQSPGDDYSVTLTGRTRVKYRRRFTISAHGLSRSRGNGVCGCLCLLNSVIVFAIFLICLTIEFFSIVMTGGFNDTGENEPAA